MFCSKKYIFIILFHFSKPLEIARSPKQQWPIIHVNAVLTCSSHVHPQPKELAGGDFLCKSLIKASP